MIRIIYENYYFQYFSYLSFKHVNTSRLIVNNVISRLDIHSLTTAKTIIKLTQRNDDSPQNSCISNGIEVCSGGIGGQWVFVFVFDFTTTRRFSRRIYT